MISIDPTVTGEPWSGLQTALKRIKDQFEGQIMSPLNIALMSSLVAAVVREAEARGEIDRDTPYLVIKRDDFTISVAVGAVPVQALKDEIARFIRTRLEQSVDYQAGYAAGLRAGKEGSR